MSKTVIRPCSCKSEYQDKKYGKGMRVMNAKKSNGFKCTVCGSNRS